MTGESLQQLIHSGVQCGMRGYIVFQDYVTSEGKLYAQLKLTFTNLPQAHMDRMVLEAKGLGIMRLRHMQYGACTYVWLPMNSQERINARNSVVWQFMKKYASFVDRYREPEPPAEATNVASLSAQRARKGNTDLKFKS